MIRLEVKKTDPFNILDSTRTVLNNSRHVVLDDSRIEEVSEKITQRFRMGLETAKESFGAGFGREKDAQLLFLEDAVNFCFWPDKGKPKWRVEWPKGNIVDGGWYALKACFERGLAESVPILEAEYLSSISLDDTKKFFRGVYDVDIPLVEKRMENLREAGSVLKEKFGGQFINVLELSGYDTVKLVNLVMNNFPSFRDVSVLDGGQVIFLKRAQIVASDMSYILKDGPQKLTNLDALTAFADYKLPQVIRMFGLMNYEKSLAKKVDNSEDIPHDSREEIEIRAATVWAVELLRQKIGTMTSGEIDNVIWLLSQDIQAEAGPYHRTRTIYY